MKRIEIQKARPRPIEQKKVAAYARVSLDNERMNHSLSAQVSYYNSLTYSEHLWMDIFWGLL